MIKRISPRERARLNCSRRQADRPAFSWSFGPPPPARAALDEYLAQPVPLLRGSALLDSHRPRPASRFLWHEPMTWYEGPATFVRRLLGMDSGC